MTQDYDVLVVGAGPVGTALALELAIHRVSFRIIDRLPVRSDKSRALVMQPRTLELLNRHGAADTIVQRGRTLRGGSTFINNRPAASANLDDRTSNPGCFCSCQICLESAIAPETEALISSFSRDTLNGKQMADGIG